MNLTLTDYKAMRPKHWDDNNILQFMDALTYLQTEAPKRDFVPVSMKLILGYDESEPYRARKAKLIKQLKNIGVLKETCSTWSYKDNKAKLYQITDKIDIDKTLMDFYEDKLEKIQGKGIPNYLLPIIATIDKVLTNDIVNINTKSAYKLTSADYAFLRDHIRVLALNQMNTKVVEDINKIYAKRKIDYKLAYEPSIKISCKPRLVIRKGLSNADKSRARILRNYKKRDNREEKELSKLTDLKYSNWKHTKK
jgi:hypothetical protein